MSQKKLELFLIEPLKIPNFLIVQKLDLIENKDCSFEIARPKLTKHSSTKQVYQNLYYPVLLLLLNSAKQFLTDLSYNYFDSYFLLYESRQRLYNDTIVRG